MNLFYAPIALWYLCLPKYPVRTDPLQVTGYQRDVLLIQQDKLALLIRCSCGIGCVLVSIYNIPTLVRRIECKFCACYPLRSPRSRIILTYLFDLALQDHLHIELEAHVGSPVPPFQIEEIQGMEGALLKGISLPIIIVSTLSRSLKQLFECCRRCPSLLRTHSSVHINLSRGEVNFYRCRIVDTAQVRHQYTINENPHVVVPREFIGYRLRRIKRRFAILRLYKTGHHANAEIMIDDILSCRSTLATL